jgi:putative transposase
MVGYEAGLRCPSEPWLAALDMAVNGLFPSGVRDQGPSLMSDNGCQPTSIAFMEACSTLEIHQTFTSDNNPKGNADTERLMRTLKEECLGLQEWNCPFPLINMLRSWIEPYHEHDLHSALGYKTPRQFERQYHSSHSPPFAAAWFKGSITPADDETPKLFADHPVVNMLLKSYGIDTIPAAVMLISS